MYYLLTNLINDFTLCRYFNLFDFIISLRKKIYVITRESKRSGENSDILTLTCKQFPQFLPYLCILPRDWYYIQKDSKFLMCTLISLLKQYFLLLITFCTYFERCSNFEFEAIYFSYVIVSKCKWVSGVDTYEAEIAGDSIMWELFARKSAECLNLRNSLITIFSYYTYFLRQMIRYERKRMVLIKQNPTL